MFQYSCYLAELVTNMRIPWYESVTADVLKISAGDKEQTLLTQELLYTLTLQSEKSCIARHGGSFI